MLELNDNNIFDTIKTGNFMLVFFAQWCSLCDPIIDNLIRLEQEKKGKFQLAKIDFDFNTQAVKHYGIFGIPIVLAIKDGVVLKGWAGLDDNDIYGAFVDKM